MKPNEITRIAQLVNQQLASFSCDNARLVIDSLSGLGDKLEGIHSAIVAFQPKLPQPASRLCRDCKYCVPKLRVKTYRAFLPNIWEDNYEYAKCARPSSPSSSFLVSGLYEDGNYCAIERQGLYENLCGPQAKFYEAKVSA